MRPRGGGAAPAGDAFAWSGIFGGSPKTTATDEGPEATTCSVRASVATVGTALPLAGPMCSAIFVANELPDVGVRVSCRICGAGRSASGIGPLAVRATVSGCCCNPDARPRSRFAKTCKVSTQRAAMPDLQQACGTQRPSYRPLVLPPTHNQGRYHITIRWCLPMLESRRRPKPALQAESVRASAAQKRLRSPAPARHRAASS